MLAVETSFCGRSGAPSHGRAASPSYRGRRGPCFSRRRRQRRWMSATSCRVLARSVVENASRPRALARLCGAREPHRVTTRSVPGRPRARPRRAGTGPVRIRRRLRAGSAPRSHRSRRGLETLPPFDQRMHVGVMENAVNSIAARAQRAEIPARQTAQQVWRSIFMLIAVVRRSLCATGPDSSGLPVLFPLCSQ